MLWLYVSAVKVNPEIVYADSSFVVPIAQRVPSAHFYVVVLMDTGCRNAWHTFRWWRQGTAAARDCREPVASLSRDRHRPGCLREHDSGDRPVATMGAVVASTARERLVCGGALTALYPASYVWCVLCTNRLIVAGTLPTPSPCPMCSSRCVIMSN